MQLDTINFNGPLYYWSDHRLVFQVMPLSVPEDCFYFS